MYVCNRGDFLSQDGLREEARSIPFARSAASNWNHTWQPVLDVFLTTQVSDRSHCAGHGDRSLVCRKDVNPHPQRCSTVNSDICTHHECHFTAGRGHFGLLSAVPRRVHLPQGHASPHKGSDIDQGISADTTGAPAILLEDSRPQAILKLRPPIRLDYSTRNGCQTNKLYYILEEFLPQ